MKDVLLYSEDGKTVIGVSNKNVRSISIPYNVTSIRRAAFAGCGKLISIEIPDSVTSIGEGAFRDCNSLAYIEIPDSVTSIGDYAFAGCGKLISIEIPFWVKTIGKGLFRDCSKLTSIEIPDSVTKIGEDAFAGCGKLTAIKIPSGVVCINKSVFQGCSKLNSIKIPDSVTSIGVRAFYGCNSLAYIEIPDSVKVIRQGAFARCRFLYSIIIPQSVSYIGSRAFQNCNLNSVRLSPLTKYRKDSFDEKTEIINMKVFISYSYDSKAHETWVMKLAEDLTNRGIYVILDKWDLIPGRHMPNFMERGIGESDKVICILTPIYKEKAQNLKNGVGYEYSVISAEIFEGIPREKFIPILRSGDFKDANPFKGAFILDMREDYEYQEKLKDLIRYIYEIPRRPPLGRQQEI